MAPAPLWANVNTSEVAIMYALGISQMNNNPLIPAKANARIGNERITLQ